MNQSDTWIFAYWGLMLLLGPIASLIVWRRWQARWEAKLLIVIGILVLAEPFACFVAPMAVGVRTLF